MRSSHSLDRIETAFDDDRLVPDAGLILPATLAHRLGLGELVDEHLDLPRTAGRGNAGDKLLLGRHRWRTPKPPVWRWGESIERSQTGAAS